MNEFQPLYVLPSQAIAQLIAAVLLFVVCAVLVILAAAKQEPGTRFRMIGAVIVVGLILVGVATAEERRTVPPAGAPIVNPCATCASLSGWDWWAAHCWTC